MKKIAMMFMLVAVMLITTGCVTDKAYGVGKTVYIGGKAAVSANADLIDDSTMQKLKTVDRAATTYDKTRKEVRKVLDAQVDE